MATQKWCSVGGCEKFIFATLDDLHEHNWTAFQTPAGKGKVRYYCPNHLKECKEDIQKSMIEYGLTKFLIMFL